MLFFVEVIFDLTAYCLFDREIEHVNTWVAR